MTRWSWRWLEAAPHRLAFFLAMVLLVASAGWWALVQADRAAGLGLPYALSPSVVHGALMTFGFMPLFFAGFLFTAGPKWLAVAAPTVRDIRGSLLLMAAGWLAWPVAAHFSHAAAMGSLAVAWAGLAAVTRRFAGLVRASEVPDRMHARAIATAHVAGSIALGGLLLAVALGRVDVAERLIFTALWGFIVAVYVTVAHRMIPFFTSSALPMLQAWRPSWVLQVLLALAAFEAIAPWVEALTDAAAWHGVRGAIEVGAGAVVVWLAFAWGLVQSLKVRLVAMLHIGFSWLGVGLLMSGASQLGLALTGTAWLPLGGLHAVTMGSLGSLMLAMVTRVTCGHGGRPLVADNFVWLLFWLLQLAAFLRIAAALPAAGAMEFTLAAAIVWTAVLAAWALRYGSWYGRPRLDGRPG